MLYPIELRAQMAIPNRYHKMSADKNYKPQQLVGVEGFEPPTPCSQSKCATRLRYTPNA